MKTPVNNAQDSLKKKKSKDKHFQPETRGSNAIKTCYHCQKVGHIHSECCLKFPGKRHASRTAVREFTPQPRKEIIETKPEKVTVTLEMADDPMQLVDELSMIYTTCLVCYATFSFSKSTKSRIFLGLSLFGLALSITFYYHYIQNPVFHQNSYALLTVIVLLRSIWVMETTLRPSSRNKGQECRPKRQIYEDERDLKILNTMWIMVAYGLVSFLGGFAIWNLDTMFCSRLRGWRREIGLPWGILLEGHGWWHLMTGIGAYIYIVWGIWLRHCLNGRQEEYRLVWPHFYSFPDIVRVSNYDKTNGSSTKLATSCQSRQNWVSENIH
ncbi:hypothetical protein GX48_03603 [Paracoccidioides brasiliensis]|nr:hypothetical protein GX48_03603 [Paracoccidioides brasiliensis]